MTFLRIDGLRVNAGGTAILRGVTLHAERGQKHALTGPNGAGKSTLLHAIAGNLTPAAGRIRLAGRDITGLAPHRIARLGIARTWQHPTLIGRLALAANIELALRGPARRQRRASLLAAHDLTPYADILAARLPYGLQRRAEFVAALATQPDVLLLDEPTAGLSDTDIDALRHHLHHLPDTTTVLLVDHDSDFVASVADTIHHLHDGQLVTPTPVAPARAEPPPRRPPHSPEVVLHADQLTGHTEVGKRLSLTVHAGEIVVVTGPNGSGKTTLLDTIAALHPAWPPSQILLHGQPLPNETPAARARRGITYAPQEKHIFPQLTVAENLAFATPGRDDEPPAHTVVWRRRQKAGTLSGGEQRLLALQTALNRRPHLLMLDEPFEGLAPHNAAHLRDALLRSAREGTAVLITDCQPHRLHLPTATRLDLGIT